MELSSRATLALALAIGLVVVAAVWWVVPALRGRQHPAEG